VRGTNDRIYSNRTSNLDAWTGWKEVDVAGGARTPDAPSVGLLSGNELALFARGTDDGIHFNTTSNLDAWTGWKEVAGGGRTPSAPSFHGGRLFVRGTDDRIYMNRQG
jgi:hypothetical protein